MAHHFQYLETSLQQQLKKVADSIVAEGKGILAMDEFNDGMDANFAAIGHPNNEENRRKYRQTILTSPGIEKYVSGVILYDETVWQKVDSGKTFPEHLASLGINPGAKVDTNITNLEGTHDEDSAQGLDNLLARARKYKEAGCTFAKWRCSIKIGQYLPSQLSIDDTAYLQARYARVCQQVKDLVSFNHKR